MRTPDWGAVTLPRKDKFNITLSFEPEYDSPSRHFIEECGWSRAQYGAIRGNYWFCAKVTASRAGIELGSNYLGGCCHKSKSEVLESDLGGYLPQMIEEAVEEAQANLPGVILDYKNTLTLLLGE